MELSVTIGNDTLKNPIGVASGTYGYGTEYEGLNDLSAIGAIYTKTVTLAPRAGNEPPRIVETPSGMLNAIGLANVGVDCFIEKKMETLKKCPSAIIANFSGFSEREFEEIIEKLETANGIWGYEVNISCPNVSHGGMAFGTDSKTVERLTQSLRKRTTKPLIVKLTPNVTDIAEIALAAEAGGADAVSCINTYVGMAIDIKAKKTALANKTGGLSGPAIRPLGVAAVYRVSRKVKIPVIGLGGIMTADDAIQYLLAGAIAIQIGTANFIDPSTPEKVLHGIITYCEAEGIHRITDLKKILTD
jgi:dihydroorotate dehydrogenase (NAD+) catalytic subunit